MKKKIITICIILALVAFAFFGKKYIDDRYYDYRLDIEKGIDSYFVNGDFSSLDDSIKLLDKYKNNDEVRRGIQNYSTDYIKKQFQYVQNKYLCDIRNLSACKILFEDLKLLVKKVDGVYSKKTNDGYTLMLASSYNQLKSEINKKITSVETVINNPNSTYAPSAEDLYERNCAIATDCDNCRDGICSCYYLDKDNIKNSIVCNRPELIQ